jgi:flavin reductase (DIM6/NTAB) family NADH-FMN oxidoreductase RutF
MSMTPEIAVHRPDTVLDGFRSAMSRLAAGVVMVTCHVEGKPWGLTVSACCSVSMSPPLLLVSLGAGTTSARGIQADGEFGVSLLGQALIEVARFGSAPGQPKFVEGYCSSSAEASRSPVVAGALAHVDCLLERHVPAGDHILLIGRVRSVVLGDDDADGPLVYHSRGYHQLGAPTDRQPGPVAEETIDSLLFDYPMPRQFSRVVSLGA